jgi:hypothetical protein
LLIGLVFWIVTPWALAPLLSGVLVGVVIGAIWAAVAYALRRRNFASVPMVVADRYEILVDADFAEQARRILADLVPAHNRPSPAGSPRPSGL